MSNKSKITIKKPGFSAGHQSSAGPSPATKLSPGPSLGTAPKGPNKPPQNPREFAGAPCQPCPQVNFCVQDRHAHVVKREHTGKKAATGAEKRMIEKKGLPKLLYLDCPFKVSECGEHFHPRKIVHEDEKDDDPRGMGDLFVVEPKVGITALHPVIREKADLRYDDDSEETVAAENTVTAMFKAVVAEDEKSAEARAEVEEEVVEEREKRDVADGEVDEDRLIVAVAERDIVAPRPGLEALAEVSLWYGNMDDVEKEHLGVFYRAWDWIRDNVLSPRTDMVEAHGAIRSVLLEEHGGLWIRTESRRAQKRTTLFGHLTVCVEIEQFETNMLARFFTHHRFAFIHAEIALKILSHAEIVGKTHIAPDGKVYNSSYSTIIRLVGLAFTAAGLQQELELIQATQHYCCNVVTVIAACQGTVMATSARPTNSRLDSGLIAPRRFR